MATGLSSQRTYARLLGHGRCANACRQLGVMLFEVGNALPAMVTVSVRAWSPQQH